jgi:hypothetical protein
MHVEFVTTLLMTPRNQDVIMTVFDCSECSSRHLGNWTYRAIMIAQASVMTAQAFVDKWKRQLRDAPEHMQCAQDHTFAQYVAHTRYLISEKEYLMSSSNPLVGHKTRAW